MGCVVDFSDDGIWRIGDLNLVLGKSAKQRMEALFLFRTFSSCSCVSGSRDLGGCYQSRLQRYGCYVPVNHPKEVQVPFLVFPTIQQMTCDLLQSL